MILVLGIDYRGGYRSSIKTVKSLGVSNSEFTFVHGWGAKQTPVHLLPNSNLLGTVLQREAENLLRNAQADAFGVLENVSSKIVALSAPDAIVETATSSSADYVVVSPTVRSNSNRPYGATTHALIEAMPTNLLIARERNSSTPIDKAVFISEGTQESIRMLQKFALSMPSSIQQLTVLQIPSRVPAQVVAGHTDPSPMENCQAPSDLCMVGIDYTKDTSLIRGGNLDAHSTLYVTHSGFKGTEIQFSDIVSLPATVMVLKA